MLTRIHISGRGLVAASLFAASVSASFANESSESRFSDKPIPLQLDTFPARPAPLVQIGQNPFLGTGYIAPGVTLPTGAVWQPVFIAYGTLRSAVQTFDSGPGLQTTEWANRLDLFGNLYLTPTERILIGLRPLDKNSQFSGYRFKHPIDEGWQDQLNGNIRTLFFEGDFGELFPKLDPHDRRRLDYGFSIGRQPLNFQDGIMINDVIDAVGVTRSSLFLFGSSAAHVTALYGWGQVDHGAKRDRDAQFLLLSGAADYEHATIEADLAYVPTGNGANTDALFAGFGYIRRFGKISSTSRVNISWALERETANQKNGTLLFQQFNYMPAHSDDNLYLDLFLGIDNYRSAARASDAGGPLGQTGILFAAVGLGNYGAPLGNTADRSAGGALGYQMFFNAHRQQVSFEVGGRTRTDISGVGAYAAGARYQQGMGRHLIWVLDAFGVINEIKDDGFGLRSEIQYKF
jgi:hypothetical protein